MKSMTSFEFALTPILIGGAPESANLCTLFKRWDNLRFSGQPIPQSDILEVLDALGNFITNVKKAEKKS